jgi:hypothetical protein
MLRSRSSETTTFRGLILILLFVFSFVYGCGGGGGGGGGGGESSLFPTTEDIVPNVTSTIEYRFSEGYELQIADKRITIEFTDDASRSNYNNLIEFIESRGCSAIGQIPTAKILIIGIPSNDDITELLDALLNFTFIADAYPNVIFESLSLNPNPWPFDGSGWVDQIRARDAWGSVENSIGTVGSSSIIIGIIDAGPVAVNSGHFNGKDIQGLTQTEGLQQSIDHATAVAALTAASGEDSSGMAGVAWNCPLRFYDASNGGGYVDSGSIICAAKELIKTGCKVINISLGKNYDSQAIDDEIASIQKEFRREIKTIASLSDEAGQTPLIVLAQGNKVTGGSMFTADNELFPSDTHNLVFYETLWDNYVIIVTDAFVGSNLLGVHIRGEVTNIAAPSIGIGLAKADGTIVTEYNGAQTSGTSLSAPLVSGSAALLLSLNPNLPPWEVKQILVNTTQDSDGTIGILDLYSAVTQVISDDIDPSVFVGTYDFAPGDGEEYMHLFSNGNFVFEASPWPGSCGNDCTQYTPIRIFGTYTVTGGTLMIHPSYASESGNTISTEEIDACWPFSPYYQTTSFPNISYNNGIYFTTTGAIGYTPSKPQSCGSGEPDIIEAGLLLPKIDNDPNGYLIN